MKITNISIDHHTTVFFITFILLLVGAFSYVSLPRESFPEVKIPIVMVTTTYTGVSPEDIEGNITVELEKQLKGIDDLEEMTSTSAEGVSTIMVEFTPDIIIEDALQKVRDKVDQALPEMPDDIDDPVIKEISIDDVPVIYINISGDFPLSRLKAIADDLEDKFEALPGVLNALVIGGLEREIRVELDFDRLSAYDIPPAELLSVIARENENVSSGTIEMDDGKFSVRIPGEFGTPMEIREIVLTTRDGKPVYVTDVANIVDTYKDSTSLSRLNGKECVSVAVTKRSGENVIQIVESVKALVEEIRPTLAKGVILSVANDMSSTVKILVSDLENNILTGFILITGVVLLFMGFRNALFVAMAVPMSMCISFIVLQFMGMTLNMMVLFSLILALGMLVDNAIVIVENSFRHRQEGHSSVEAAKLATAEVAWPVISSTLTTVCAFFPMVFWPGIMGQFMSYLPMTVIIALLASLAVAMVINPTFCARFMKAKKARAEGPFHIVRTAYEKLLRASLNHRAFVMFLAISCLIGTFMAFALFNKGTIFFPEVDPNNAFIDIEAPEGTNLDATNAIARIAEVRTRNVDRTEMVKEKTTNVGKTGGNIFGGGAGGANVARINFDFIDREFRKESSQEIIKRMRKAVKGIPGAEIRVDKPDEGPPTGEPVQIEISGDNFKTLKKIADEIKDIISKIPGLVDVKDDFVAERPELAFRVDRQRAPLLGLSTVQVAQMLKLAINGIKVGTYRELNEDYDITLRLPKDERDSIDDILRLTIPDAQGNQVPLSSVARMDYQPGLGAVNRKDSKRVITISGQNAVGYQPAQLLAQAKKNLADLKSKLPSGYQIDYTGENKESQEAQAFLSKAMIIAVFFIFLVLITQFNSIKLSLIIIISVIMSLMGVLWGLLITGTAFGIIMTGIGVVSLAGVVVNNAIVIIDYMEKLRKRGNDKFQAAIKAGSTRLRPVLLTTITTILGLLPMAIGISFDFKKFQWLTNSETSQWWQPMAVTVIFGLGMATLLTLILVLVLYTLMVSDKKSQDASVLKENAVL